MKRLLTLAAMFLCCITTSFAQFSGSGSGTENDPYLILNPIHLNQLRNFLNQENVYFKLMADVDLTEFLNDENPTQGWQPVGSSSAPFKGILDGNGHSIDGLWINRPNADYVGFFGCTDKAVIKNLTLSGDKVNGNKYTAFLSAYSQKSTISNCVLSGSVNGSTYTGGYIGWGTSNTISSVMAAIDIASNDNFVGGIIGCTESSGSITGAKVNCMSISGNNYIGGICGCWANSSGNILNSVCYANLSGIDYVGGVCGNIYGHSVFRISTSGFIGHISASSNVGGVCGEAKGGASNSKIDGCYAIGDIAGAGDCVGGIVGYSQKDETKSYSPSYNRYIFSYYMHDIADCYHSGIVKGLQYVGGITGYKASGSITHCYSRGIVQGSFAVGGISGKIEGGVSQNFTMNANISMATKIVATSGNYGRIYGEKGSLSYIGSIGTADENKSLNRTIVISAGVAQDVNDDEQNGTGVSPTTLKLKATYVAMGWDFTDTWEIQETECYPYFKKQTAPPVITSSITSGATVVSGKCVDGGKVILEIDGVKQQMVSSGHNFSFNVSPLQAGHEVRLSAKADGKEQSYYTTELVSFLGKGTEADPYQVYTAADLTCVYRRGYYKQMNDIDLADYINQFSPTEGWQSIGRDGSETIHYDGAGHKVTGLWCNTTRDNTGLFSCFANGEIKNLTVETAKNKQVKGGANTGIIIGKMMNGTITNCRVSGTVADGTPVGGIVGLFDGGAISNCQAKVTINTTLNTSYVGGLVGATTGGTIDQCFTEGTLTATGDESYVGGIVGKNMATLTNSNSTATITSSYNAAGVVAYNYGLVDKCYATGNLFSNNYAAGVIGYNDGENAVVSNCVAMNNKIEISYESQQQQQGGGYGQRIIGGIKNGAPAPEMNNYALKTMQVSLNDVTQKVYDDIMNGTAKTAAELTKKSTYQELDWDFSNIWKISEGAGYPYLNGTSQVIPDDPGQGGDEPEPVVDPDTDLSSMNNVIYLNKVEASAGSQINLSIRMKNAVSIRGFQFDLYLPDGVTVVKSAKGKIVGSLSDGRLPEDDEHTLTLSEQSDGAIRFLCGSLYDETFTGNDGEIATLSVKIAENMADGNYAIILKDIKMTETDINNYYQTDQVKSTLTITSYTSGDINGDGKVDVSDYIGIANHIMGSTPEGFVVKAADVNEDGLIDVSDYIGVANIILTGSIYGNANNARMFLYEEDVEQEIDPE